MGVGRPVRKHQGSPSNCILHETRPPSISRLYFLLFRTHRPLPYVCTSEPTADAGGGDGSGIGEEPEDEDEKQPRDSTRLPLPPLGPLSVAAATARVTGNLAYRLLESVRKDRRKCCCCCWARRTRRREGSIARWQVKRIQWLKVEGRNLPFSGAR